MVNCVVCLSVYLYVCLQVFQTFVVSFNEQRRPVMPLLTAMRRSPKLSQEQRALREAWDALADKVCETFYLVVFWVLFHCYISQGAHRR